MKKSLFSLIIGLLVFSSLEAQQVRYLVFEFIKVESGQTYDFIEYNNFMEKVYQAALNDRKIQGWDFWSIQSGADAGEFQYITITYFNDPVTMMSGLSKDELIKYALVAYPHMNEKQIRDTYDRALQSRDLAQRAYMEVIASTKDDFKFKKGVLASFDLMKANEGRFQEYEQAEKEVFLPSHQKRIQQGLRGSWSLLRTALPMGSEAKYTHLTINLYDNYIQFFNSQEYDDIEASTEQLAAEQKGLQSRDQKWVYLATLETAVRR